MPPNGVTTGSIAAKSGLMTDAERIEDRRDNPVIPACQPQCARARQSARGDARSSACTGPELPRRERLQRRRILLHARACSPAAKTTVLA